MNRTYPSGHVNRHTLGAYTHPMLRGARAQNARGTRCNEAGTRAINRRSLTIGHAARYGFAPPRPPEDTIPY